MLDLQGTQGGSLYVPHQVTNGKKAFVKTATDAGGAVALTTKAEHCYSDSDIVLLSLLGRGCDRVYEYGVVSGAAGDALTITLDDGSTFLGDFSPNDESYIIGAVDATGYQMVITVYSSNPRSTLPTLATAVANPGTKNLILQGLDDCEILAGDTITLPTVGISGEIQGVRYSKDAEGKVLALVALKNTLPTTISTEPLPIEVKGKVWGQFVSDPVIPDRGYFRGEIPRGLIETLPRTEGCSCEPCGMFLAARYSAALVLGAPAAGGNRPLQPLVQIPVGSGNIFLAPAAVNIPI